jgi:ParB family chromosome partitioning protein
MSSAEEKPRESEYKVIAIDVKLIDMGPNQARTQKVEEGLDDLAENIRLLGLLNPITVYKKDGRYELVAGQRRFLAVSDRLKWKTIPARILPSRPKDVEAKAISLSENIIREDLTDQDLKNSIMLLYTKCGASGRAISDTLGIPYDIVLDVIKYEGLPKKLQEVVDAGDADLDLAKRATKASLDDQGRVDEKKALELLTHMRTLMPEQQKVLVKKAEERPEASIEEIVEEAKEVQRTKRITITMLMHEYDALKKYANSEGIEEKEAAVRALSKTLKNLGYLP